MPTATVDAPQKTDRLGVLRVSIAGEWETQEFGELLRCITFLYRIAASEERASERSPAIEFDPERDLWTISKHFEDPAAHYQSGSHPFSRRLEGFGTSSGGLRILKISYASPGVTDFVGIGRAIERLLEFLKYVIDLGLQARARGLELEMKKEELNAKKIENTGKRIQNAAKFLELAKAAGLSPDIQHKILLSIQNAQESLIGLAESGKITRAEKLDSSQ